MVEKARSRKGAPRSRGRAKSERPEQPSRATKELRALSAVHDLLKQGHSQGYVTEEDLEALVEHEATPVNAHELDVVRQLLFDEGVEVTEDEAELAQTVEDVELEEQLDQIESEGQPIQSDPVWQ